MTSKERTILTTTRDCPGRLVPVGDPVTIPAATFVTLVQSLGGSYTVTHQGNMIRVDGTDADALGLEPIRLEFDPRPDGQIDEAQVWEAQQCANHTALACKCLMVRHRTQGALERIFEALNSDKPARFVELDPDEELAVKSLGLLTKKPVVV